LADRTSENPINDGHPLPLDGILEWEHTYPLEKVINSRKDLDFLLAHADLLRNLITIIEPCINYKDFETKRIRRSFSCQFHPELMSDLRAIG